MSDTGIRFELAVESPADCPVADVSADADGTASAVARTANGEGDVVEEFSAPGDAADERDGLETVFEAGDRTRYRFERDAADPCFCEAVEAFGRPVTDVRAESGTLVVTVHADDVEQVRSIVEDLRTAFGDVSLRSLSQDGEAAAADPVLVDRARLTDRQREVVETARDLGYFDYPKGANAGEVAEALDISVSTLAEHLAAAQTKILDDVLV